MDIPCRKGSVFVCLIRRDTRSGSSLLSTVTSLTARCWPGSNSPDSPTVSSPDLRKPKKATQHAAHSITWRGLDGSRFQTLLSFSNTDGVRGSRVRDGTPACSRFAPRSVSARRGMLSVLGSPPPHSICRCRTADR